MTRDPEHDARTSAADLRGRLELTERNFRLLVESVKDYAIFMLDRTGNVASWNAGAHLIKGYTAREVIGKHLSLFYTPEDQATQKPYRLLDVAIRDGRVEDEGWRVRKDGSRFWADVVITALRDAAGDLIGFAKVTRDLTPRREAEERLRDAEERLATTLYSIGDGVLATDEKGHITIVNRVAHQLTGWSEQEAMGRKIHEVFDIVNESTRARVANPVTRVLAEGRVVGLANHTVLIARDGTERPIADSGAPILDPRGRIRGAVLVFRDVTNERRAEEALRQSEERLRQMIASVYDYAIFMLDSDGRVVSWNPGAERIKGYKAEEIIGEHFSRFFTPEDVAAGKPVHELQVAAQTGRFEDEAWRIRKDGSLFWANVVISAIRDAAGRLIGFTKVTRDLTERHRMEQERVRGAKAQEAVRLRDEFLSIASHELKTPLTALQLQLQALMEQQRLPDEKLARKLQKIKRTSERLGHLVESLLDVSRIATGQMTLGYDSFDLVEAAREVIDRMGAAAESAGCDVSLEAARPAPGRWDRLRVEQVLMNMLSNAFKYAAGGPVAVVIAEDGELAQLEVRDGGPGLPAGDTTRLFDRFERGASTSYGGLGLGLYVANQIVEAHGGTITARTIQGHGASFVVRLPREPSDNTP